MSALAFNYEIPEVPDELVPDWYPEEPEKFNQEILTAWKEVCEEVLDTDYLTRRHGNAGTYDQGCRGPMCRKSYREHPRRQRPIGIGKLTPRYERAFDPILEYFHTVIRHRIKMHQLLVRAE